MFLGCSTCCNKHDGRDKSTETIHEPPTLLGRSIGHGERRGFSTDGGAGISRKHLHDRCLGKALHSLSPAVDRTAYVRLTPRNVEFILTLLNLQPTVVEGTDLCRLHIHREGLLMLLDMEEENDHRYVIARVSIPHPFTSTSPSRARDELLASLFTRPPAGNAVFHHVHSSLERYYREKTITSDDTKLQVYS